MLLEFILVFFYVVHAFGDQFNLFGSSDYGIVGERFELTCVTKSQYLVFGNQTNVVATIIGVDSTGRCMFGGSYIKDYIYSCNSSTYTYKLTIPGILVTEKVNMTTWNCQYPFGGAFSNYQIILLYPDVQITLTPVVRVYVKKEKPVAFKCRFSERESWRSTVYYDDIFGAIATAQPDHDVCNITVTNNLYKGECTLTPAVFILELSTSFQWFHGHHIRCVAQYGSANKTTDKFIESSTVIEITESYILSLTPSIVHLGSNTSVRLICSTNDGTQEVQWWRNNTLLANVSVLRIGINNVGCSVSGPDAHLLYFHCDEDNRTFVLTIPPNAVSYGYENVKWTCSPVDGQKSNSVMFTLTDIPINTSTSASCYYHQLLSMNCTLPTHVIDFVMSVVWYHTFGDVFIRIIEGNTQDSNLQIPFCSYQDMGEYTCLSITNLPGIPSFNSMTSVSFLGPPVITETIVKRIRETLSISVKFYSKPLPTQFTWMYGNQTLTSGVTYQMTTFITRISLTIHQKDVWVDGFASTLEIRNFSQMNEGTYTFSIENMFSITEEKITTNISEKLSTYERIDLSTCSSGIIGGVAVGCIALTIVLMVIIQCVIRKLSTSKSVSKSGQSQPANDYDQLGMRSLPHVYDSVTSDR